MAKEKAEVDPSVYLTKPATDLQERFADWITEVVGYDPSSAKTKEAAFREGVRIATATRMVFQASPENREANAAARKKAAEVEEEEETPKAKPSKKIGKKAKAKPVVVEEDDEDDDEAEEAEEAPAPKAKKAVKKGGKRTRRAVSADEDEAPF